MRRKTNIKKGYSIIELLVVIAIFSIISVIVSQSLVLSLRGSKKSESVIEVKNNVDVALSTMERLLRNAKSIDCSTAHASGGSQVKYVDEFGANTLFACVVDSTNGNYIASGSASPKKLTNNSAVEVTNCVSVFSCPVIANSPPMVEISIKAQHKNNDILGSEGAIVESRTRVLLRTY